MMIRNTAAALAVALIPYSASHALDVEGWVSAGSKVLRAATLSDADIKTLSDKACAQSDSQEKIAAPDSKYDARLRKIVKPLNGGVNGRKANYKVYLAKNVNAWAMANGCIRVYSGLMDRMTDDEVRGVVSHEIGHVALGHSKKAMQTAYTVSAARDAIGTVGGDIATLNASRLGDLTEKFINAQFSQSQETAADDYAFDQLQAKGLNPHGLVTAFQKLAELDGGKSDMMSSHPSSAKRAQHIEARIAKAR